jgi:hypothetical protein
MLSAEHTSVILSIMTTNTCHKCNGTGYRLEVAHCDGGRCWHCNKVDTSYTLAGSAVRAQAEALLFAQDAQRRIERRARAAARRSIEAQS